MEKNKKKRWRDEEKKNGEEKKGEWGIYLKEYA